MKLAIIHSSIRAVEILPGHEEMRWRIIRLNRCAKNFWKPTGKFKICWEYNVQFSPILAHKLLWAEVKKPKVTCPLSPTCSLQGEDGSMRVPMIRCFATLLSSQESKATEKISRRSFR